MHRVIPNFLGATFDARFFNCGTHRLTGLQLRRLLGVRFGPNGRWTGHGIGGSRRQFRHFADIGLVRTNVTFDTAGAVDFEGRTASRTKWPGHRVPEDAFAEESDPALLLSVRGNHNSELADGSVR